MASSHRDAAEQQLIPNLLIPTFWSVDAVASSDGAAGLKLREQAGASCANSRHSGALPADRMHKRLDWNVVEASNAETLRASNRSLISVKEILAPLKIWSLAYTLPLRASDAVTGPSSVDTGNAVGMAGIHDIISFLRRPSLREITGQSQESSPPPLRASNAVTVPSSVDTRKAVGVAGIQASASESALSCHRRHSPPTTRMSAYKLAIGVRSTNTCCRSPPVMHVPRTFLTSKTQQLA